jgi:LPS-assembly lipoprotein
MSDRTRNSGIRREELDASRRFWLRAPFVFAAAAACGGCFQPLYGSGASPDRPGLRDALNSVDIKQIDAPANSPEARLAVQIRNELLFSFTGGGASQSPTHELTVKIGSGRSAVTVDSTSKLPTVEIYALNTTYTLADIATKKVVVTGRASTSVSYDTMGTQRFARIEAMRDAERRAAKVIADNIATRMAAYFVSGG